ncbi:hypothetical protein KSP40_PGU009953 [Platanthera guangdongensis]|uniref:Uncharacterized protein n=1 Tax=Platanthera guangdongensis TaxID=2320717 RepID=A0ABR2MXS7_9ASPA
MGTSHSFIAESIIQRIVVEPSETDAELSVCMPSGPFMTTKNKGRFVCSTSKVDFVLVDTILPLTEFDVILGLD